VVAVDWRRRLLGGRRRGRQGPAMGSAVVERCRIVIRQMQEGRLQSKRMGRRSSRIIIRSSQRSKIRLGA